MPLVLSSVFLSPGQYFSMLAMYSCISGSFLYRGLDGSLMLVELIRPSAAGPARPMSVLAAQVAEPYTIVFQPVAWTRFRAAGHASRVAPMRKASALVAARVVTCESTMLSSGL